MKLIKSCLMALAFVVGTSSVVAPAYAIYNPDGDLVMIIYYPDGTVVY